MKRDRSLELNGPPVKAIDMPDWLARHFPDDRVSCGDCRHFEHGNACRQTGTWAWPLEIRHRCTKFKRKEGR